MKQQALLADKEIIVGHCILDPGESAAEEVHAAMNETIVVLRGRLAIATAWMPSPSDDIDRRGAGPGVARFIPAGIAHAVANASATEPVEFLAIMRKVATEAP